MANRALAHSSPGAAWASTVVRRISPAGAGATLGGPVTDQVAAEEPLEVRIAGSGTEMRPLAVVMRTPGEDFDLAWGLTLTEQVVSGPEAIASARWGEPADFNAVEIRLRDGQQPVGIEDRRPWLSTASCGLCGKESVEAIARGTTSLTGLGGPVAASLLVQLPDRLRARQGVFERTGGLHAAGAFDLGGEAVCVREDIGRHNAVDKVVGHLARQGRLPAHELVLAVSGRAGFEIVQKAAVAGIPVLVCVSAPSSLAIRLAQELGLTLAGFARRGRANLYSGAERITG